VPKTLAEIAIDAGLVNRAGVARAARAAEQRGVPLLVALIRDAGVDEVALLAAIRKQTRVPALDPASLRADPAALRRVPRDLCERHRVLPLAVSGRLLQVGMADPTDAVAIAELEHVAGVELEIAVLPLSAVEELIDRGFGGLDAGVSRARRPFGEGIHPATQPHLRGGRGDVGEDTALTATPSTVPFHSVADEADVSLRLRALVGLLEAKGVLGDGELDAAVIDLMRAGRDIPDDGG
jgi:hypothetical protein